jgi:hypothetical protein
LKKAFDPASLAGFFVFMGPAALDAGGNMSVWLSGREGELVSVSISVDPRDLEALLESLASVKFPVNPQIHHGARTSVEFPAYAGDLGQVRTCLEAGGFDPGSIRVVSMLEEIHSR